ncbi:MAG: beta strand repeat-containing protein [Roseiarcus sp.]
MLESLPLYNNNVLLGYGIPNTVEGVPTGFIEPLGGAQGGDPNASTDVADALASDPSKTLYNYMEVYLFEADSVFDFAQSLDYLNTVIGVGPGLIDAVIVQTGNGTGTDLTTPIVVNAEEAANDTKVLAVTATSYYVAGGSAGAITAAPGADLALEVADSAANIAADLPTILQSMKGYTDFVRLYLDLDDTGENIAGSLLSIEKSLDTISSTANAFFESNDTGNYDYVTVAMNSSDTGSLIPFTVGQYQQVFEDPAFYNIFTGVGAAAPHTIEIIDTAANIEGLSTLLFLPPAGNNVAYYGSYITKIVATDGPLQLSVNLASELGALGIGVSAQTGGVSVLDSALGIGLPGGGGLSAVQIQNIAALGVTQIASNDDPIAFDAAQVASLYQYGMHVSAYEGGAVTLEDSAALIDALLANLANSVGASQIGARLQKIGVTAIDPTDAPIALTMAEINSLQQAGIAVAPREATLEDSSADIPPLTVAEIDALSQFGVSSIEVTDGVRLPISVSAAKELVDLPVGSIAVGPAGVTISGAAADIEGLTDSELSALATQDVAQFASTDVPIQLRVDQAQAIEQGYQQGAASEPAVGGPAGAGAIVSDAAWAINGLSASDILAFGAIGVTTLNANDGGSIVFDATPGANQAAALAQAQIGSASPVTVADTAANIELLTPAQIAQLAAADHVILSATDVQLELSVDQVTALENGGTAPGALLYDLSANIDALTAQQISDLASIGLAGVSASDNAPLVLSVDPSNDQAAALIALMKTGFGVSPGLIILGSAIDIEALSVDAIARIASIGGTLASTDAPLQLTVDQVTALASGGNTGTASGPGPNGAMVYYTAANIAAGLTPFLIANLADLLFIDTIDVFDGPLAVTVAQAEAAASGSVELTAAGLVSVADSEQNIQAIDPATLPALAQAIVQPSQGSGSTRTVIETNDGVSQIVDLAQGLAAGNNGFVFEDPQGVQIQDTEQTIQSFDASQFQKLAQGVEKPSSGSGQAAPTIILTSDGVQQIVSVAQGVAAGQNGFVFEDAQGIEIQDTAQNIQGLGAGDFATLAKAIDNTSGNPTIIDVVDGLALTLSIAQAIAAGNGNFLFEDSDGVEIDDTTANFEQLGPSDYATLHAAIDGPGAPNPTPSTVLRTTDGQVLTLTLNDAAAALGYGFEFEGPLSIEITGSVKDLLALTPQQVALLSDVGANAAVAITDSTSDIQALTAPQITEISTFGASSITSTDGSLTFDTTQALAAAAGDISFDVPTGDNVSVVDAAAAFGDLTAQQIAGLGDDGFDALASTSGSLALDVSQGLAAAAADLSVSAPSGDQTAVVDAAAALGSLTAGQIGQLSRSGFTQLDSTAGSVTLDAAQAIALEDPMTVVAPAGDTVTLSDTAAAIEALTAAEIAAAGSVGFTNLVATDASLQFTVAQALAIEFANLHVSVPQGDAATVVDSSANLATLTSAEIAALAALGVIVPSAPPGYSVAYYLANQTTLDASGNIAIADTAVNVAANLDALNADSHIASIALTDGGTPTLTLSVEQAVNDRAALAKIVSAYTASVADTAVNIAEITSAQAAALKTDGYASVASTTGAIKMTTAEALLLIGDGVAVTGGALIATGSAATIAALTSVQDSALAAAGYALEVVDVASDIEALTPAKIAGLGNLHVAEVEASDASLAVSATQAIAFENAHILLTAPPGDSVSLADTAAHLRALTATEISALKAAGVDAVTSSNGAVAFTVAQALALEGAGLAASAIGGAVTLADGAGHIGTLTAAEIEALPTIGFSGVSSTSSTLTLTVAQAIAFETIAVTPTVPGGGKITISDAASSVALLTVQQISGLPAIGVSAISATGASLTLSVAQAVALETAGVTLSAPGGNVVTIADEAANINALTASEIAGLKALHVSAIASADTGATLDVAQADALEAAKVTLSAPKGDNAVIIDAAANIETQTSAEISSLASSLSVNEVEASDASLAVSATQAIAFENAHILLTAPPGDSVSLADTAAHLQALTAAQIAALPSLGVAALVSDNANVSFSASQTSALITGDLSVSATGADSVSETLTSGAVIVASNTGAGAGTLTLSGGANNLEVDGGASELGVTAGSETLRLANYPSETISAVGRTNDTFAFLPSTASDAWTDSISGFAAGAAPGHDFIQLALAAFDASNASQAYANMLADTSAGANAVISDVDGDKLTLTGVSKTSLTAVDFKFV